MVVRKGCEIFRRHLCAALFICSLLLSAVAESSIALSDQLTPTGAFLGNISNKQGRIVSPPLGPSSFYEFVAPDNDQYLDLIIQLGDSTSCDSLVEVGMSDYQSIVQDTQAFSNELKKAAITLVNDGGFCTRSSAVKIGVKHAAQASRFLIISNTADTHAVDISNNSCSVVIRYAYRGKEDVGTFLAVIFIPVVWLSAICIAGAVALAKLRAHSPHRPLPFGLTLQAFPMFIAEGMLRGATAYCEAWQKRRRPIHALPEVGDEGDDEDLSRNTCRICKEDGSGEVLVAPCECMGTCQYVHQTCLNRWRLNGAHATHCEICTAPFALPIRRSLGVSNTMQRFIRYSLFLLAVAIVCLLSSTLLTLTLGQSSCFDESHHVSYSSIWSFKSLAFGASWYFIFTFTLFKATELVRRLCCLPCWMQKALSLLLTIVPQLLVIFMGYGLKFVLYSWVEGTTWSWETSPEGGVIVIVWLCLCCLCAAAFRVLFLQCFHVATSEGEEDSGEQIIAHRQERTPTPSVVLEVGPNSSEDVS